jgi:branched-chain amino acid transport system substrate-binding protein
MKKIALCGLFFMMVIVISWAFLSIAVASQETVRIGALFPFSGPWARLGNDAFTGVEVARILKNEQGGLWGKKIEFVKGDAVDPKAAQTEAERLITVEKVKLIVGTYASAAAFASSAVAEKNEVIYWETGAGAEKLTGRGYKYFFRCNPHTGDPGYYGIALQFFMDYAPRLGIKKVSDLKVAIVSENSLFGVGISEASKKSALQHGMKVVVYELYDKNTTDLSSLIVKLKAAQPDALLTQCFLNDAILLTRQSKELDFNVKMFSGVGSGHNMEDFVNAVGDSADGIATSGWPSINMSAGYAKGLPDFLKAHKRLMNQEPQSAHVFGNYNGGWLLFNDVLPRAGSLSPEAVRKAALATDIPWGGTPIGWGAKFGEDGQIQRAQFFMNQWQKGKLVTVWPEKATPPGVKIILPYPTWAERAKKK